ncbi:DUF5677 domain-containing protein [Klebsiella pneumoniae]|uniref:DUF5677 domain-containing protein n=1 Tax=Klebsiella pneumoniae TaxID=573 RepID=UPI001ABA8074|nr:DUF5677 domain-containing protein [Klebsiella pneumoniae]HDU6013640.1 hypothetical protein [Klebsiella pneumoniae subsp. pneumoniae]MCC5752443.1 DUF5677 domain-containing protein [Klebsiella pneumoniae]MCP3070670.1 DUF5677 domain-containing protein [Klebsiella pneumoniae]MCS6396134.1 hypothetical protein [Klebsiella pneumoniae]HBT3059150.1 hypothetical protein [Klebsiella pneumoniae]
MDTYHKIFLDNIERIYKNKPESCDTVEIEKVVDNIIPEMVSILKESLANSTREMLAEYRSLSEGFVSRNISRWGDAFDLFETLIVICTESGEEFNKSYRAQAVAENDLVFDLVVRHHARACHIANEILCLLKNGFADAAHARWRALHEVAATAMFIAKHGKECAERFYYHEIVDSYNGMLEHKKYEHRLQAKGPSFEEVAECKEQFDLLIKKYGKRYADNYGWASYIFPNHTKVGFGAIEKDVNLEHMRPYYKWASQNIHTGSKAMRNRLGLCETNEDILLVGQSNSGMTDPAHATAISLVQVTVSLLFLKPNIDNLVISKIIQDYSVEVGETFLKIDQNNKK